MNKILNQKIANISLLSWSDYRCHSKIQEVLIEFENNQFLLLKSGQDDVMIQEFYETYSLRLVVEGHEIISIYSMSENPLSKILDKEVVGYWELKNEKGVVTALEMEVIGGIYRHTFRFLIKDDAYQLSIIENIVF